MTAKEYLSRYLSTKQEIERLLEQRLQLWSMATKITPTLQGDRVQGGQNTTGDAIMAQVVDLSTELLHKIKQLNEILGEIESAINSIQDERLRMLLKLHYINGKTFEEISVIMHYNYRWVTRLHGKALTKMALESPIN